MRAAPGTAAALLLPAAVVLLAACGSGPAPAADGEYRALASSSEVGDVPPVMLGIDGSTLSFREGDVISKVTRTEGSASFVVCPPDGRGAPETLGQSLSLGSIAFDEPALIGDCGTAAPARVTVVDLASADEGVTPFPFTRWVEFCDTTDPDC